MLNNIKNFLSFIENKNLTDKFYYSFSQYFVFFMNGLRSFLLASMIKPVDFSLIVLYFSALQILPYFGMGVRESVSVLLAKEGLINKNSLISNSLISSLYILPITFLISLYILLDQRSFFNYPNLDLIIRIVLPISFFLVVSEIMKNILRHNAKFITLSLIEIFYTLAIFVITVLLINNLMNISITLYCFAFISLITAGILFVYVKKINKLSFHLFKELFDIKKVYILISSGIGFMLTNVLLQTPIQVCLWYSANFLTILDAANFSFAFILNQICLVGLGGIFWTFVPKIISSFQIQGDELRKVFKNLISIAGSSAIVFSLAILTVPLLDIIFKNYNNFSEVYIILSVSSFITIFSFPQISYCFGTERKKFVFISAGIGYLFLLISLINLKHFIFYFDLKSSLQTIAIIHLICNFICFQILNLLIIKKEQNSMINSIFINSCLLVTTILFYDKALVIVFSLILINIYYFKSSLNFIRAK